MAEELTEDLQSHLQAHLNCLELCQALHRQSDDPHVRQALAGQIDGLQESLASLAGFLRRGGVAPGTFEPDRQGKARVRKALRTRSLREKLLAVREGLAGLLAWHAAHPAADETEPGTRDWLASLSERSQRLWDAWERHMHEMKAQ